MLCTQKLVEIDAMRAQNEMYSLNSQNAYYFGQNSLICDSKRRVKAA